MRTPSRELTLAVNDIIHPEWIRTPFGPSQAWLDSEVKIIVDLMHNGDPTLGWPGDPRLGLYRGPDNKWEVWRLEADGEYRLVMRSKPNAPLNKGLIVHLVRHDIRNGFDPAKEIIQHNQGVYDRQERKFQDQMGDFADRLHHALRKDGV